MSSNQAVEFESIAAAAVLGETFGAGRLLALCRHFGMPVPDVVAPEAASLWLKDPGQPADLEAAMQAFTTGPVPEGVPALQAYDLPLQAWGAALLEARFDEDLIASTGNDKPAELARVSGGRAGDFETLAGLIARLRLLLGERDWLLYWGQDAETFWLLGVFPRGWDWPGDDWLPLPDAPLPKLVSPLTRELLVAAARDWREIIDPAYAESEANAYDWLEVLGGRLVLPAASWEKAPGFVPGRGGRLSVAERARLNLWPRRIKQLHQAIWDTFRVRQTRFQGLLQQGQEMLRLFLPAWLELGHQIRCLAAPLQANGRLPALMRERFGASHRLANDLLNVWEQAQGPLEELKGPPDLNALSDHGGFRTAWQLLMGNYGHLGPWALDLTQPRFADREQPLLELLVLPGSAESEQPADKMAKWLAWPHWQQLSQLLDLRERLLWDLLWALHQLRLRLGDLAREHVKAERLGDADSVWWLQAEELRRLDAGEAMPAGLSSGRRHLWAEWARAWQALAPSLAPTLRGIGLGSGMLQGWVWRPASPWEPLPEGWEPDQTILVTGQIDAGWLPCLAQVAGVVLSASGPLDAGTLLLHELAKPAVVALPAAARLSQGQSLRLDCEKGTVSLGEG